MRWLGWLSPRCTVEYDADDRTYVMQLTDELCTESSFEHSIAVSITSIR